MMTTQERILARAQAHGWPQAIANGVMITTEHGWRSAVETPGTHASLTVQLDEMDARVVQHELDHLDGVLILERTTDEARRGALATLRQTLLA